MTTKAINIKVLYIILFLALIIIVGSLRYAHWQYLDHHPSTKLAVIQANLVPIASQIPGTIDAVYIKNNSQVKRGDLLFEINSKQCKAAILQAQENLIKLQQQIQTSEQAINTAEKLVNEKQEQLSELKKSALQTEMLVKERQLPAAESKELNKLIETAASELKNAEQQYDAGYQQLGKRGEAQTKIKAAQLALQQAQLNLEYTFVAAPTSGFINGLKLKMGMQVAANKPLFNLIENNEWWIEAPFNKYQLKWVQPRQLATVVLSTDPHRAFNGVVDAVTPKGVKIKLLNADPNLTINVGAPSTVTIDTQAKI